MKLFKKQFILLIAAVFIMFIIVTACSKNQNSDNMEAFESPLEITDRAGIVYQAAKENPTSEEMDDTLDKLKKRAEAKGIEANIIKEGNDSIRIEIPDVEYSEEIFDALGKPGILQVKDPDGEIVFDGSGIEKAEALQINDAASEEMESTVKLTLKSFAREKFAEATEKFIGQQLSIEQDGEVLTAPVVQAQITDGIAIISGGFNDFRDAEELASVIHIGALPFKLKVVDEY